MRIIALLTASAFTLAACEQAVSIASGGGNDGLNRVVDVVNETGVTMMRFYASNTSQNNWGQDQLGSSVLGSGQYITINFDDGTGACIFDFKAEFSDGDIVRRDDINVCVESSWTVF